MKQKISIYLFNKHIANMFQDGDRVYLQQVDDLCYKASPISLSKDLKEIETTHLHYLEKVAGFISDSLPGNFGNEIFQNFFLTNQNKYPTVSDKLLFIGNKGLGALTFHPSKQYDNNMQETLKLKDMFTKAKELQKGGDYHSLHSAFLVSAHSFIGGARSKAVCGINLETKEVFLGDRTKPLKDGFIHAIIKYDDTAHGDENRSTYSKIEYIYYLLAKKSGIEMMECFLVESDKKHHFVTKRFDIESNGKRYHVHSLAGLLQIDYNIPRTIGYEDLLRTAVKLNATKSLNQLFLQMLFNYMFVNQDDHSRNFSFMCDEDFQYKATPAYDITFSKGEKQTVEHQLSLYGKALSKITIDDITQLALEFSIDLEFVANGLETMKNLRDNELPKLLKQFNIPNTKQNRLLNEVNSRDLQGAINE
ncbi:MAG: type II toxin-antitoxin system HipA family toxin [Campylobacterota bacterium]